MNRPILEAATEEEKLLVEEGDEDDGEALVPSAHPDATLVAQQSVAHRESATQSAAAAASGEKPISTRPARIPGQELEVARRTTPYRVLAQSAMIRTPR